ncbi:MAG: CRISPR-associated endoribonuclease Cas6, partial [Candidatus Nitrosocaldaceae archaeon]
EIHVHGNKHIVIGTLWRFWFNLEQYERCSAILKLLQFALDVGFGERNSLGFGFMNIDNLY